MAKSVNRVILLGRIGKDPELKYTSNGTPLCRFSMATDESWTDKSSGDRRESVQWHNCVAWNRTAEIVNQYVAKGSLLYVEGSLQTREWDDQQGNKRKTTEIRVTEVTLLGGKNGNGGGSQREPGDDSNVPQSFGGVPRSEAPASDDDIPF